jgi:hypothetical protein
MVGPGPYGSSTGRALAQRSIGGAGRTRGEAGRDRGPCSPGGPPPPAGHRVPAGLGEVPEDRRPLVAWSLAVGVDDGVGAGLGAGESALGRAP